MPEKQNDLNIILDFGNTLKKIAVFQKEELISVKAYKRASVKTLINYISHQAETGNVIISSVIKFPEELKSFLIKNYNYLDFTEQTKLPIKNNYKTPLTLGKDRLASAVAAYHLYPGNNVLAINAGSCLTFDIVNADGSYLGGIISPGLQMRFKALHNFTHRLPLLNKIKNVKLTGNSTETSIISGVLNGIIYETDGIISEYEKKYNNLKVVISGGDINFFEKNLKSPIFAYPNLVLTGLNIILKYNVRK